MAELAIQTLIFLRWVQMGSTPITGFIACYLVWWHNYYDEDVPLGLSTMIVTSIVTVVENYISQASLLSTSGRVQLNYPRLSKTSGASLTLLFYGYNKLFSVRDINFSVFCDMTEASRMYGRTVEKRNCVLVCDIFVAGAIAVTFSAFITIFSMANLTPKPKAQEQVTEDVGSQYGDFTVGRYDDDSKPEYS